MTAAPDRPRAWTAAEALQDRSWQRSLSPAALAGLDAALAHAGQTGKPLLDMDADDFPLDASAHAELQAAFDATQKRWGFCLLRGLPVRRWTPEQTRLAAWGIGLHVGVARTQNAASEILNDVRDAGGQYQTRGGRGYNTRLELDFHIDFADVVALLCRRTARAGGRSLVTSSLAVVEEIRRHHPDLAPALEEPLAMSWQGTQAPGEPPVYLTPLSGSRDGHTAFRTNRKNLVAAQRDFPQAPRWTERQRQLIDTIDRLCADPRLCLAMDLGEGDLQLLNNYVVVHSRTAFEDFEAPDEKRHLLRLWLNLPSAQPLPQAWSEAFKDTRAGAVRGGVRGSRIGPQFIAYEMRQARRLGMANAFSQRYPATLAEDQ
ncbi:TauD/TfdA family dioxygenase [Pseudorhodoferax sp.]|uniref:TauD/TfdA family dioxygenase n=1 Tax=Pseudorhodoferax sp. TaxID=1993553 RepID=UPI002DD61AD8|nr:TauD/TfdA family dioxygenase [Pseudorhodoferax sp.]